MKVWAGVLAAGQGRRLGGRAKALLTRGSRPFLEIIAETARQGGAEGVAVVLGHHAREIEPLANICCDVVTHNEHPERGMGSSARELARVVPDDAALLLWPVDMPGVRASTVAALIEAATAAPEQVVTPMLDGYPGHPPLLPSKVVRALGSISNEARLDEFIASAGGAPLPLEVDDEGVVHDVDLPDDLRHL